MFTSKTSFKKEFRKRTATLFGKSLEEASDFDRYAALASMLRDSISEKWVNTNSRYSISGSRQVYYFSLEFLTGQFLEQELIYLDAYDICEKGLKELGIDLKALIDTEPDAGLGNGGLGRLAACFLDSMAALNLPGHGCGIRYKYGLFQQKIVDGYQVELPDNWLHQNNAREIKKPDKAVLVKFGGNVRAEVNESGDYVYRHENFVAVNAVPYDMPVLSPNGRTVNTLRLWSAEAPGQNFDFASFSRGEHVVAVSNRYAIEAISEVLYPDDSNYSNRVLRLKQQYFFVSAGLQSIIRTFLKRNTDLARLPEKVCIQINDTHPSLAVPELMRILIDENGFSWEDAWKITTQMIAYTNHTIMPEALEKWAVDTFREQLPRIYMIVEEINRRFCKELLEVYPNDQNKVTRMAIVRDGVVHMANLAIVGSFSVNGVAAVHTELLKSTVLRDFYEYYPEKFNNKTNGITHRRWLIKSNRPLTALLNETIGQGWMSNPNELEAFLEYKNDKQVLGQLAKIKRENKLRLAEYISNNNGLSVDPDSIFDVQVKRIHAYKRQLLNLMHILSLYNSLHDGKDIGTPRTFIFAGKAAPSYYHAKNVIKLANEVSRLVNTDPVCKGKLNSVFLENYGIRSAEIIFPAAEVSEQISTAFKEASGTSNMKFMMNGAVTIGTEDGANIEIHELVGDENYVSFGLNVEEVLDCYRHGNYRSIDMIRSDPRLAVIIDQLLGKLFTGLPADEFSNIVRSLTEYNDEFFVLKDFDSYLLAHKKIEKLYRKKEIWNRMSLVNIAMSGRFSSDNTIAQYAKDIWEIEPCGL